MYTCTVQTAGLNWFLLLALRLYSELGFPLYKDTDLGRATAHQLYCFAIEVGFGAIGDGSFDRWQPSWVMGDPLCILLFESMADSDFSMSPPLA